MTSDIVKAINESYAEGQRAVLSEVFGFIRTIVEDGSMSLDHTEIREFKFELADYLNLSREQREAYGAIRE